jgi:hypothetical protein
VYTTALIHLRTIEPMIVLLNHSSIRINKF